MLATKLNSYGRAQVSFEAFVVAVAEALVSRRQDMTCAPAQSGVQVHTAAGLTWSHDLSQMYSVWLGAPALRHSLVLLAVASICDRATLEAGHWAPALHQVLPVVHRRDLVCESDALFRPFARSLAQAYILDRCGSQTLVTSALQEQLADHVEDLRQAARDNLNARLGEVSLDRQADGVWLVGSDTLPASSVLFSDTFWRSLQLTDAPLFAIPADAETLVVFAGHTEQVQNRAIATALEIMDTSAAPFTTEIVAISDLPMLLGSSRVSREA